MKRATIAQSFSVSFTVGLYGIAFGAAGIAAGFSILQTCLLSLLTFSGASQFAVVGVIGSGGSAVSGIATASLLGIRNGLYGLRMAPILKVRNLKRVIAAQITIDESIAVSTAEEVRGDRRGASVRGPGSGRAARRPITPPELRLPLARPCRRAEPSFSEQMIFAATEWSLK